MWPPSQDKFMTRKESKMIDRKVKRLSVYGNLRSRKTVLHIGHVFLLFDCSI